MLASPTPPAVFGLAGASAIRRLLGQLYEVPGRLRLVRQMVVVAPLLFVALAGCLGDAEGSVAQRLPEPKEPLLQESTLQTRPIVRVAGETPNAVSYILSEVRRPSGVETALVEARLPAGDVRMYVAANGGIVGDDHDADGDGICAVMLRGDQWGKPPLVSFEPMPENGVYIGGEVVVRVTSFFSKAPPEGYTAF
jgi:hypothetical protein